VAALLAVDIDGAHTPVATDVIDFATPSSGSAENV
jgi:hypothetical protein